MTEAPVGSLQLGRLDAMQLVLVRVLAILAGSITLVQFNFGLDHVRQAALAAAFCWFALPAMVHRSWSLPAKLGAVWGAPILVRVAIEIASAVVAFADPDTGGR